MTNEEMFVKNTLSQIELIENSLNNMDKDELPTEEELKEVEADSINEHVDEELLKESEKRNYCKKCGELMREGDEGICEGCI
jgi:hypothetical protein